MRIRYIKFDINLTSVKKVKLDLFIDENMPITRTCTGDDCNPSFYGLGLKPCPQLNIIFQLHIHRVTVHHSCNFVFVILLHCWKVSGIMRSKLILLQKLKGISFVSL